MEQIIAAARAKPESAPARGAWLLSVLTAVMLWAAFTPLDWGPLGWIALVPLILLIRIEKRTRWMYAGIYFAGLVNALASLQWMRLGHVTMYTAWIALSVYIAFYFPVFVLLSRVAVHRFAVPMTFAVPAVWVGLEYLRAHLMTGFSWYYLGHTQYRWIPLIQICDLVGAYGVSFVVAAASACVAGTVPVSLLDQLMLLPPGAGLKRGDDVAAWKKRYAAVAFSLSLFVAALAYGYFRRAQAEFTAGPRVAVVQGNFPSEVKQDPSKSTKIHRLHYFLTGQAVKHQPDVVVWPETMYRMPLLVAPPGMSDEELKQVVPEVPVDVWRDSGVRQSLSDLSTQAGAAMILGIETGVASQSGLKHYNSAVFVKPQSGIAGRYDKLHRVVFGEYIPLKKQIPWLHALTPFSSTFGIDAGESIAVFHYKQWRFAPLICFEDTVPHLIRRIVKMGSQSDETDRSVDCLVNLTNDGWFHGSSELDQHLITALFRCVEYRTPMVRAVNTGISAVIDGDGIVVEPDQLFDGQKLLNGDQDEAAALERARISMRDQKTGRWRKQMAAVLVDDIPLDNRRSLYVVWGDWFAAACLFFCLCAAFAGLVPRRREQPSGNRSWHST